MDGSLRPELLEMARLFRGLAPTHRPLLQSVCFYRFGLQPGSQEHAECCTAIADGVIGGELRSLNVDESNLAPGLMPHLSRMLREGRLLTLCLANSSYLPWEKESEQWPDPQPPLLRDFAADALSDLCAALRAAPVESLTLEGMGLW